jgi:hypothetical protein
LFSLQQSKYKKVLQTIEDKAKTLRVEVKAARMKEDREQMQTNQIEIYKRQQQKTAKLFSQQYRKNNSIDTRIRINCRQFYS